jgi:hypothetical protein
MNIMKTEDLRTITTVALGTAMLTVMTFWSGPLEAGNEGAEPGAQIEKPKLVTHGLELSLAAADGQTLRAGEAPTFQLTAVNLTGEPATAAVCVEINASSPADLLSRVPRRAEALWQQYLTLPLKPHETRVVSVPANKKLPANSMVAVSLRESESLQSPAARINPTQVLHPGPVRAASIVALNFSTITATLQTASVR